jgi:hypothetical protein
MAPQPDESRGELGAAILKNPELLLKNLIVSSESQKSTGPVEKVRFTNGGVGW